MVLPTAEETPRIAFPLKATAGGPITNNPNDLAQGHIGISSVAGGERVWVRSISDNELDPVPSPRQLFSITDLNRIVIVRSDGDTDTKNGDYLKQAIIDAKAKLPTESNPVAIQLNSGTVYDLGVDYLDDDTDYIYFYAQTPSERLSNSTGGTYANSVLKAGATITSSNLNQTVLVNSKTAFININLVNTSNVPCLQVDQNSDAGDYCYLLGCSAETGGGTAINPEVPSPSNLTSIICKSSNFEKGVSSSGALKLDDVGVYGGYSFGNLNESDEIRNSLIKADDIEFTNTVDAFNTNFDVPGDFDCNTGFRKRFINCNIDCGSPSFNSALTELVNTSIICGSTPFVFKGKMINSEVESTGAGTSVVSPSGSDVTIQNSRVEANTETYSIKGVAFTASKMIIDGNILNAPIDDTTTHYAGAGNYIEEKWVSDSTNWETTGWEDINSYRLDFNDTLRTLTVSTPTSPVPKNYYTHWQRGVEYRKTSDEQIIIPDTEGLFLIYYINGVLNYVLDPDPQQISQIIRMYATVAYVYWNATDGQSEYLGYEPHTRGMPQVTHTYNHFAFGARYLAGLDLTDILADQNGSLDTHAQFGVLSGSLFDEDVIHFPVSFGSTVGLKVYYLIGPEANPSLRSNGLSGFSVTNAAAGERLAYNQLTGGNYQLTECTNGYWLLCHVFANNSYIDAERTFAMVGQEEYSSIDDARDAAKTEIFGLRISGVVGPEMVPVATVIFQTGDSGATNFSNAAKARIVSTDLGADYVDHRRSLSPGGGGTAAVPVNLDDLADVSISSPAVGHFLRYNGTNWENIVSGVPQIEDGLDWGLKDRQATPQDFVLFGSENTGTVESPVIENNILLGNDKTTVKLLGDVKTFNRSLTPNVITFTADNQNADFSTTDAYVQIAQGNFKNGSRDLPDATGLSVDWSITVKNDTGHFLRIYNSDKSERWDIVHDRELTFTCTNIGSIAGEWKTEGVNTIHPDNGRTSNEYSAIESTLLWSSVESGTAATVGSGIYQNRLMSFVRAGSDNGSGYAIKRLTEQPWTTNDVAMTLTDQHFSLLSDAARGYVFIFGWSDQTTSPSLGYGAFLIYDERNNLGLSLDAAGTGENLNWKLLTVDSSGQTYVATTKSVATAFKTLRVEQSGSTVEFFVDATRIGAISTNVPNLTISYIRIQIEKNLGTANPYSYWNGFCLDNAYGL